MIVNMEFQGMEQLLKNLQEVSSLDVVGQCTRHIINLSKLETHRTMKRNVPRSRTTAKPVGISATGSCSTHLPTPLM